MKTQRAELLSQLAEHGWCLVSEETDPEWWADEMRKLESSWSPVGSRAYISLMVDPVADQGRKKGEAIWAMIASPTKAVDRLSEKQDLP